MWFFSPNSGDNKVHCFLVIGEFYLFLPQMRFRVNTECIISLNKTSVLAIVYLSVQIDVKADLVFRCHTNRQ